MSENKEFNNQAEEVDVTIEEASETAAPKAEAKKKKSFLSSVAAVFATLWRWTRRMFMGASKDLANTDIFEVEKLESPSKLAVKTFFRRKIAVTALVVLVSLFLFVFIGPLFLPMDINYTDALQKNMAPNYSLLKVPSGLKKNIRDINGFSNFTVGVSNDNELFIWGATKDALTDVDLSDFPEEIKEDNVYMAAAGLDHVIAMTTDGKLVGWGDNNRGQYRPTEEQGVVSMPVEFETMTFDTSKVTQLAAGYQVSALIYDGRLYMWGNTTLLNMTKLTEEAKLYCEENNTQVTKVVIANAYAIVMYADGTVSSGGQFSAKTTATSSVQGKNQKLLASLAGKKVVDIAASNYCFAILTDSGEIFIQGAVEYNEDQFAKIPAGEKVVSIVGGTRHFVVKTDAGKAYAWGHNDSGQTDVNGKAADEIFVGAKQSYLVDENDKLTAREGLKGYIFGTDNRGRDTFTRIVHGGKMTMTVGAVAVIVSTIIAIIIGCLSGYFGGWVDMLLMRITEIFSAIPFLPFAMMLSYIIRNYPISDTMRIIIIMVILGLLSWTGLARMIRGQVLAEREKEFVIAAKSMGVKENRIAFKHILPNVISVILVSVTLDFAGCLLTESSLSYLGFGVQQPQPTWGNMLDGANNSTVIQNYWWQWLFPSIFLSLATISINIIGDTLRDVLDPKSSREK